MSATSERAATADARRTRGVDTVDDGTARPPVKARP
jgi:hypothetical protein